MIAAQPGAPPDRFGGAERCSPIEKAAGDRRLGPKGTPTGECGSVPGNVQSQQEPHWAHQKAPFPV